MWCSTVSSETDSDRIENIMEEMEKRPQNLMGAGEQESGTQNMGQLKIFFGYASGVGKTYAMLKAAHTAQNKGIDVVVGYMASHISPQTAALLEGLERVPVQRVMHEGIALQELNLDAVIKRRPQLVLIDELAHTNVEGCRHTKRYQDIEELLKLGINVYTTVNVQHIESLNDIVTSITRVTVCERILDSVFDGAAQVELVDIEPEELMERMNSSKIYPNNSAEQEIENFFTVEKLTALREIALRRCADRVNLLTENARTKSSGAYHTDEHILVCLSAAPSNAKVIRMAARMANAFRGMFTALYVETPGFRETKEEDKKRLRMNIRLAQQLGAKIETVYGEDVPFQIAEFARLSGVSKIVIGRSKATKRYFWSEPALTEKLIANAPNLDIHIIPDSSVDMVCRKEKLRGNSVFMLSLRDTVKSIGILVLATIIGLGFSRRGFTEANIIVVYILGVLIISIITTHRVYSLISSMVSVLVFNFFFTVPKFTFLAYDKGYPVTFLIMFLAAFITGTLAARLKNHAKQSAQSAYRTKILFDTNQLLQQAEGKEDIVTATAEQLIKLLQKDIVVYFAENDELGDAHVFPVHEEASDADCTSEQEKAVAEWVLKNNKHAGATTDTLSNAKCLYYAIRVNDNVYGVVGIVIGEQSLDVFENSVLLSILGECALALENEKNLREKEEAAILARNEQLRANMLRAISHDLRTPLTSISGNASNLISNGKEFDENTKQQIYTDIYDDAMWLITLVENLLAVTRIEEGRINLKLSAELMDEVITEALKHVNRKSVEHHITVESQEEFILAKMDARLIVQVVINLVDNAIKYTPPGSSIRIVTKKEETNVIVEVMDDGPGISEEQKPRIFDMFYSGANQVSDSRRSLGLGLSLCRSIINAHGGTITVSDNCPKGTVFRFTLPAKEVSLHE